MNKAKLTGFTLIEILMSVATIGVIAGMSAPVYHGFQVRNDASIAIDVIAQSLRRAQLLSQAMDGDTSWGVSMADEHITLFRGTSYSSRNTDFDETFPFFASLKHAGVSEVVFSKLEGRPLSYGSMNIDTSTGVSYSLAINSKGIIEY